MGELLYETTHEHLNIQSESRGNQHSGKWFLMKNFSSLWGLSKRFSTKISMVLVYINRAFMPSCYHYSYAKVVKILTLYFINQTPQYNKTQQGAYILQIMLIENWNSRFVHALHTAVVIISIYSFFFPYICIQIIDFYLSPCRTWIENEKISVIFEKICT